MGKKDEYRFNLRFDETDEMHRLVVKYLNSCGHNKAKYTKLCQKTDHFFQTLAGFGAFRRGTGCRRYG